MRRTLLFRLLVVFVLSAVAAGAAPKPPPKRVVLGTTQLKGDQAVPGVTYTLGKTAPINFTLDKAEYVVSRVKLGSNFVTCKPDEKLLVIHYTLHNPNKTDFGVAWSTLNFQAVDAKDKNWRYITDIAHEDTGETGGMSLKPAQKTKLYVVIVVPAEGQIPKLIVEARDHLVLRYDLRGKVKPIPAPIADPADPSGATALQDVPAKIGEFYPLREFDAKLESVTFVTDAIKGRAPRKDQRYVVFNVVARNAVDKALNFGWNRLEPELLDADGGSVRWNGDPLFASRDETVRADVQPGKEIRLRYYFEVPVNLPLDKFSIREFRGRRFVWDIKDVK